MSSLTSNLLLTADTNLSPDETSLTSMSKLSTTLDISQISSPSSALNSPSLASLTDITTTAATPSTSSASTTVTETLELSLLPTSTALYQTLDSPLSQPSDLSTISDLPEIISSYQSIAYGNSLSPTTSSGSFDSECLLPTCVQIAPDFISSSSSNIPTISPTDTAGLITAITESVTLTISLNYGNSDVSAPFTTDASPTISSTPATDVSVSSTASQSAVPYAVCIQPSTSEIDVSNIQPTGTNQLSSSTSEIAISDVETFTTFYSVDSESPNSSSQSETQYTSSIFQSTTVLPIFATESLSSSSSLISTVSADLSVITLCSICGSNTATTITNSFETLSAPSIIPIPLSESGESSSPSSFSSIISPASQVSESPTPHVMTTVVYTEFVTIVSPSSTTGQLNYLTSFPDLLSPGIVSPPSSVDFESQSSINTLSGPSITSSLISTETSQGLLEIPTISGTSSIIISEGIVISVLPLSAISNSYTLLGSSSTINLPSFESPSTYLQPTEEATFPGSGKS